MCIALRVLASPLRRASRRSESTSKSSTSRGAAFAFALLLIFSAFKASRAPQAETAEEARVFERSEFPRRAVSGEEHRAPPHRGGGCQALPVLLPFAKTKGRRAAKPRESSALALHSTYSHQKMQLKPFSGDQLQLPKIRTRTTENKRPSSPKGPCADDPAR
ncbi:hypothetical protein [Pseudoxanthomonas sp. GM95]|uniref:hypothetical protein n=1 Tax=Pseudoxanthomonas sp. GM95 TaxID=1881043 RepID=UPI001587DB5A|nr:hypothetical protein [Pseudoxanthomonas sp. GM95]